MREPFLPLSAAVLSLCACCIFPTLSEAQSNILVNGDFEMYELWWNASGAVSFDVNGEPPAWLAAHGNVWVELNGVISQEVPTVPGRDYVLKFATLGWASQIVKFGEVVVPSFTNLPGTIWGWPYVYSYVKATGEVTTLEFQGQGFTIDDIHLGWLYEPVSILTQPESRSVLEGGTVGFSVLADGGPPLYFQWNFNDVPIEGATNRILTLTNVHANAAGTYSVLVSNSVTSQISSNATLVVNQSPRTPVIVRQPESDTVPAGYACSVSVVAIGEAPLTYQWRFNGTEIPDATNADLTFNPIQVSNSGTFTVLVANRAGSVLSLPAFLTVTNTGEPSIVYFSNRAMNAPVYDIDATTRLLGSNFVAQLYAGPTPVVLRPVGPPMPFKVLTNLPGYFYSEWCTVPDVPPGDLIYLQARVWEIAWGASYEAARARGGKFGFSPITSITAPPSFPPPNVPMISFGLRGGEPLFSTGKLQVENRLPRGQIVLTLTGEAGFRYLVEKKRPPHNWFPLLVLTNMLGTTTFADPEAKGGSTLNFYRSRILD